MSVFFVVAHQFIGNAQAAWPDSSASRTAAIQILREDIGTGYPMLMDEERTQAYSSACNMKRKYFPICHFDEWVDQYGKTDLQKVAKSFDHPTEPLALVVTAWSLGFTNGVPSEQSVNPQSAAKKLELACYDKSYAPGCSYLGDMYAAGVGVSKNTQKAFELYEEACEAQDIYGCAQQGLLYMAQQDYQSALSYLSQGCSAGFTQHCSAIGDIYNQGVGISKDTDKAISYYQKGCSQNNADACYKLAELNKDEKSTAQNSFGIYSDLCMLGDLRSCFGVGMGYELGIGTPVDLDNAMVKYEESCDQDYAAACSKVGEFHLQDKVRTSDIDTGEKLVQKGCEGGDILGCVLFADILSEGSKNVAQDIGRAMDYYEQGCDNNFGNACLYLGKSFDQGKHVGQDHVKAIEYFEKGCENANGESCRDLGERYLWGLYGVTQDVGRGLHFLAEGCKNDDNDACKTLAKEFQTRVPRIESDSKELKSVIKSYQSDIDNLSLQLDTNL